MEPLIYYPTFEPLSDVWLKFSLVYFDTIKPIVPNNRQHLLSDNFKKIRENTDLITLFSPDYNTGFRASIKAIEETEKILERTYERSYLFNSVNLSRKWHNPSNWNFLVYNEKFSMEWINFCTHNGIGKQTADGLLLPEELAFLFMTHLAKEIAFLEEGAIITDNNKFDNYTNFSRATTPSIDKRTKFAKGIFSLQVPKNLSELPIDRLIDFRNKNRDLLSAFNHELDNVQTKIGHGYSERDFINSFNEIYSEYSMQLLALGLGIASIPLAAYIQITNSVATTPEYVYEILGSLGIILGGGYSLNKALKDTESKRYCKKYLTNLERLK